MKKLFFVIILLVLVFFGVKSFMEFENGLKDSKEEKTEESSKNEDEFKKRSIFNDFFVYQGFINYDSTEMSAFSESYNKSVDTWDNSVIEDGIDLKIMGESIVSELSDSSSESLSILIYFEEVDTKDLNFIIDGVDSIELYGTTDTEVFEIELRCQEMEIDVNSFLANLSMIKIVINDYSKLLNNGGYIKTL